MNYLPYLVQRGQFKPVADEAITGIDSLIQFDYMGSAEFEFGQLPKSLKAICGSLDKYQFSKTGIHHEDSRGLWAFCKPEDFNIICDFVKSEMTGTARGTTKERTDIRDGLRNKPPFPFEKCETNFWWDIEHNWFVFLGEKNVNRVRLALHRLIQKKGW